MKLKSNILYVLPVILCLCAFALWGVIDEADKKFAKLTDYNIVSAEVTELPKENESNIYKVIFKVSETGDKGTANYITKKHLSLGDNVSIAYHYQDNILNVEQCMSSDERNFVIGIAIILLVLAGVIAALQYSSRGNNRIYNKQVSLKDKKGIEYSETVPDYNTAIETKEMKEVKAEVDEVVEEEVIEDDDEEDSMFS